MNTTGRQVEYGYPAAPRAIANEWTLLQQAIAGDATALELLFAPHMGRLHRVARNMLRNREDAEDALQDGLYKAFRHLHSFQGRSSFSTWLTRIVMNSALMTLRRKRNHPESSLDEILNDQPEWILHIAADERNSPEQLCALSEFNAHIERELQNLSSSEQATFRYFAIHGRSARESSSTLGIPESTYKSRILRTRRKLAHRLRSSLGRTCVKSTKGKSFDASQ